MVDQKYPNGLIITFLLISLLVSCNNYTNNQLVLEPISSTKKYEEPPPPLPPDSTYPTLNQWLNKIKSPNPSDTTEKIVVFRLAETSSQFYLTMGYFSNRSNDLYELVSKMKNMPIAGHPNIQLQEYQKMSGNQLVDVLKNDIKKAISSTNFLNNNKNIKKIILAGSEIEFFELYP
ncbi:hypothetical protein L0U88_10445 [Flavihumibacter sp. RY-1]|uniref:Uncharacterized protein n=1 Tax=Flavihumibacter fluminis TaxID=2909236 RepID=A0ABS9BIA5_9BACT|nr:hypothetical protein [Flavihumibacter fluminis]MCF1715045.1 hypothetical protein [Flavihumibacter fluminis]